MSAERGTWIGSNEERFGRLQHWLQGDPSGCDPIKWWHQHGQASCGCHDGQWCWFCRSECNDPQTRDAYPVQEEPGPEGQQRIWFAHIACIREAHKVIYP